MFDWLSHRTRATPNALALIINEQQYCYADLDRLVDAVCGRLIAEGVASQKKDGGTKEHVAVLMPNCLAYVCLIHAVARLGAVLVPLNTRLTKGELTWQLEHVDVDWLICDETMAKQGKELNCQLLIVNSQLSMSKRQGAKGKGQGAKDNRQQTKNNKLQAIVFTSGTTGNPKGVMVTFDNHFYSAMGSAYRLGLSPDDCWLSVLPLYHVGGLAVIFRSCLYGTAVTLHPRFNLDQINHSLDTLPITLISLVPTMLHRLLKTRTNWPASLRLILLGGAATTNELIEKANQLPRKFALHNSQFTIHNSPLVATTYGLTEAASQVATQTPEETARKLGSVGKPLMFTTVEIVDDNGRYLPPNQHGEIVVSGPTVMAGYLKGSLANSSIKTGDIGYMDEDGDLWLLQRRSDIIISGGENVYPAEVEKVLRMQTAVSEACVVGVPDPEWGQKVVAMVTLTHPDALNADSLIAFCRQHLAGYKQPRQITFVAALPQTASGKIHRKLIQKQLEKHRAFE